MDYNQILSIVTASLPIVNGVVVPGIKQAIHIFQDQDTGETTVTVLERAKAKDNSTLGLIEAWNKMHQSPPSPLSSESTGTK